MALALDNGLPDRLRGVVVAGLGTDPATLPQGAKVRLHLEASAVLWREIPSAEVPADLVPDLVPNLEPDLAPNRRTRWIETRLEPVSPWAPGTYLWAEAPGLRLALTAAAPVRALEKALATSGRRLVEVQMGDLRLHLDPQGRARRLRRWIGLWLGVMALGITLAGAALWQIQTAGAAADLARARLTRLAAEATARGDRSRAILELAKTRTAQSLSAPLNRLAASLPLDSYLLTLRLTAEEVQIAGQSAASDAIVPALQAGGFTGVDFAGASALDAATGLYSFTIHGKIGRMTGEGAP